MKPIHFAIVALSAPWVFLLLVTLFKFLGNMIAELVVMILGGPL